MNTTTPIKFVREAPGQYVSECGIFRIHRTEHSGRHVGLKGRHRWWITHVPSQSQIWAWGRSRGHQSTTSLEDAVKGLNTQIARSIVKMFMEIKTTLWEVGREERERAEKEQVRRELEARIIVGVRKAVGEGDEELVLKLVSAVADSIQAAS